jgi:hypothetical protein
MVLNVMNVFKPKAFFGFLVLSNRFLRRPLSALKKVESYNGKERGHS